MTVNQKSFSDILKTLGNFQCEKKLAVALSGGGDSMALAYLLSGFCKKHKINLHILTVDHGLRSESKKEAKQVSEWIKNWPAIHKILTWTGEKPKTRIQEEARKARYFLMSDYCQKSKIKYLFLAHHGDDQMETFLFRLAKGSGIDGLSVMLPLQGISGVTLVRPLLNFSHEDLISVCKKQKLNWVEDPSNEVDKYARVRLRQAKNVLKREGLTSERILTLSKRLMRARNALEQVTDIAFETCTLKVGSKCIEMGLDQFLKQPKEIGLRLLQKCLNQIGKKKSYPASLQILEKITDDIYDSAAFRAATLGGCVIRRLKRRNILEISTE